MAAATADQDLLLIPDSQQEDESDLSDSISFKDAIVMNADWTIETIVGQISKKNIDLQPGFQRRAAWDDVRKSRLVESIIVGMPVPNIVLAENKDHRGRFIVIDGKQRLLAINDYLNGGYALRGLDIRPDLNGLKYNDLAQEDREYLENSTLRSTVIRNWKDENFLYAIFFRLNSGSLPLSPQELRKALVGGNLLDRIEEYLESSAPFQALFGETLDKRMRDSELVLRFIAYDRALEEYRGDFKDFLDQTVEYYEASWEARKGEAEQALIRLDRALITTMNIFSKDSFKKWIGDKFERVINRAVFDCITRYFADEHVALAARSKQHEIYDAFKDICKTQEFRDAIEKTPKTVGATKTRINMWGSVLAQTLNLTYDQCAQRIQP
ncbi:DUF262 domain-containing protein [Pseudomonas sp. BNK-45]|uniref:DUF262 domain-containing protein n=1 Tax=Pseudomonas sp. BNK-45 TaxID=3376180 RepID=UPI0039BED016